MKRALFGVLASLVLAGTANAQDASDSCGNAPIVGHGTYAWDLDGKTNDASVSCGGSTTGPDVWLDFYAISSGPVTVSTCGLTTFDSVLAVFDGCGGSEIQCLDDSCGLQTAITINATAGTHYFIRIARFNNGTTGAGQVRISGPDAADSCGSAPTVGYGLYTWDLVGKTNDASVSCGSSTTGPDVWLDFFAPSDGPTTVSTCGLTTFDSVLAVFGGCGGAQLLCLDDFCGLQTQVTFNATAGTHYLIRIAQFFNGDTGSGQVTITGPDAADSCSSAPVVGHGTFTWDLSGKTNDASVSCGASTTGPDVWLDFLAPIDGPTKVSTCGLTRFDSVLAVFDACGGSQLLCLDDSCGLQTEITINATAGTHYLIRIARFANGSTGSGFVTITGPEAADSCAAAPVVGYGRYTWDLVGMTNDASVSCGASTTGPDVWLDFLAPNDGLVTVSTCGQTEFDSVLAVFDGCGGSELLCLDDSCGLQTEITINATAGTHYLIRIAQFFNGTNGSGYVTISELDAEDNCTSAPVVGFGTYPWDLVGKTNDASVSCGGSTTGPDVWLDFHAPSDGPVTISTCGLTAFDSVLAVFDGCGGSELVCLDDFCGLQTEITINATAGAHYLIRIAQYFNGTTGSGYVTISGTCDPDVNCDGSPDQGDVACMILAVAGDTTCICQDPDFNLDGSADQGDVAALIGVVAGQPCP